MKSTHVFSRRYFVHDASDFGKFSEQVCKIFRNNISPTTAVALILQHRVEVLKKLEPVPVFVYVDEFRKLFDKCSRARGGMDVLSSIDMFLSQPEKHTVVISTLESTALIEYGSFCFLL